MGFLALLLAIVIVILIVIGAGYVAFWVISFLLSFALVAGILMLIFFTGRWVWEFLTADVHREPEGSDHKDP